MSEKVLIVPVYDNPNEGLAHARQIDCFLSDFGVEHFLLRFGIVFNISAAATANMKAYGPAEVIQSISLIGSRAGGGSDVFVQSDPKHFLWRNTIDYGLTFPEVVGPYGAPQPFVGPGTWSVGCAVRIDMAPPRMIPDFRRHLIFPGNGYKTLALKVQMANISDIFYGTIPASLTVTSAFLEVVQTQQPTAYSLDTKEVDLFYYQRFKQDDLPVVSAGQPYSYAPVGSLLEGISVMASSDASGSPNDFLASKVSVFEQTTSQAEQSWGSWRTDNFDQFQIGNPQASWGRIFIPWAQDGLPENLLDTRTWQPGKTLKTQALVTAVPPLPNHLSFYYDHIIGPFGIPGR